MLLEDEKEQSEWPSASDREGGGWEQNGICYLASGSSSLVLSYIGPPIHYAWMTHFIISYICPELYYYWHT